METLLGMNFLAQLSMSGSLEVNHVYRRFLGARDPISYMVLIWLVALAISKKVSLYCSDVAAAFD